MDSNTRNHDRQFPLKKLEALVKIAIDYDLHQLVVGDITICPRQRIIRQPVPPSLIADAEKRIGRPLTELEIEDEILFGPGGSLKVDE